MKRCENLFPDGDLAQVPQRLLNSAQAEITGEQVIQQLDPTHAIEVDGWFYAAD